MDAPANWISANLWVLWTAGAVAVAVLSIVAWIATRGQRREARRWRQYRPTEPAPVATMEERITFTAGGIISLLLLILHNIGVLIWLGTARSAVQEAALAAFWIGGNVLWGLGVALGRRRHYRIYRVERDGSQTNS